MTIKTEKFSDTLSEQCENFCRNCIKNWNDDNRININDNLKLIILENVPI